MEIADQLLSGEGTLLTNDSEKLRRGLTFFTKNREYFMLMTKKKKKSFVCTA